MIKEFNSLKKEKELAELDDKNKHKEFDDIKLELDNIDKRVEELRKEIGNEVDSADIKNKLEVRENEIGILEDTIREIDSNLNQLTVKKKNSADIKHKILQISKCPTCEQVVEKEHKDSVTTREDQNILNFERQITESSNEVKGAYERMKLVKVEIEELRKELSSADVIKLKINEIREKEIRKENLIVRHVDVKRLIGMLYSKKTRLEQDRKSVV